MSAQDDIERDPHDRRSAVSDERSTTLEDAIVAAVNARLDAFQNQIGSDVRALRSEVQLGREQSERANEHVRGVVTTLWEHVFPSTTPPPPPPPANPSPPGPPAPAPRPGDSSATGRRKAVHESISEHDQSLAGISGQLITANNRVENLETQMGQLLSLQKEQMGKQDKTGDTRSLLTRVVDTILWTIREREGQKYVYAMFAAITGLLTTLAVLYALLTRQPIMLPQASPALPMQYGGPPAP